MKKICVLNGRAVLTMLVASVLFFNACEKVKEPSPQAKTPENIYSETEKVLSPITEFRNSMSRLSDPDQRGVFRGMSPEMKSAIWRDRLADALTLPLKENQKEVILSLIGKVSPDLYQPGSTAEKEFLSSFYNKWIKEAKNAFPKEEWNTLINIVTELGDSGKVKKGGDVKVNAPIPSCKCNIEHDFCPYYHTCGSDNCDLESHGCGWLWVQKCSGMCHWGSNVN